jgi:hypothetical protein
MNIVRLEVLTSGSTEFEINYGKKTARIRLENLEIPDDAETDWKAFYKKCLTELFDAIQADGTYWTDRG